MNSIAVTASPWLALLLMAALLAIPGDALAQERELDRVETLIADGDYERARAEIAAWWEKVDAGHPAPGPQRARALLLRGRLEPDPKIAELDYLTLVLTYPTAPEAPEALLRLGQGLLATGDSARASAYLERLVNDHPSSPQRSVGAAWLARVRQADGTHETLAARPEPGQRTGTEPSERRVDTTANTAAGATAEAAAGETARADGRFAVQSGAFRQRQRALELAERLRCAGHEPRLVGLPGSSLVRVRVGRFADRDSARALARRLIADGFEAFVVADAEREQPTR